MTLVQLLPTLARGGLSAEGDLAVIGGARGKPVLDLSPGPVPDRELVVARFAVSLDAFPPGRRGAAFVDGNELIAADLVSGDTLVLSSTWPVAGCTTDLDARAFGADTLLALTTGSRLYAFQFTPTTGLDLIASEITGYDDAYPGLFDDPWRGPCVAIQGWDGGIETYLIDLAQRSLELLDSVRFRPRFPRWRSTNDRICAECRFLVTRRSTLCPHAHKTCTSYSAILASRVTSTRLSERAWTTCIRSKGSWWWAGSSATASA